MAKQVLITVYNDEEFQDAIAEIKSNLDYDNIEYDYKILEENRTKIKKNANGEIEKASANFIQELDCYEVELIKNGKGHDTTFRIETIDEDYFDITVAELHALKELLNNEEVSRLLRI